jgi:hypothetical protein
MAAPAQPARPNIEVNLRSLYYPRQSECGCRGDQVFEASGKFRRQVSGDAILGEIAGNNLASWTLPQFEGGMYVVTYHFNYVDEPVVIPETVLIGNRVERFFLGLFRKPTERIVEHQYNLPAPWYTLAKVRGDYKIDVFVVQQPATVILG